MRPGAVVVYDACVLYPAPLRDILMWLACAGLFRARWSERILDEWIGNLLAQRPDLSPKSLERTRILMNAAVPDAVIAGFEHRIEKIELPDPGDRHVVAAAIEAHAERIITLNERDYPKQVLRRWRILPQHPDEFILELTRDFPDDVIRAAREHRMSLRHPGKTVEEYLDTLAKQQLGKTAAFLHEAAALI